MNLEAEPTTWVRTRTYFLTTQPIAVTRNFGIGVEASFVCPRCNRTLPRHVVTVDHVVSRAQMSQAVEDFVEGRAVAPGGLNWDNYRVRGVVLHAIDKGTPLEKAAAKSFIHKNAEFDLDNLLMMCSLCNTRKNST